MNKHKLPAKYPSLQVSHKLMMRKCDRLNRTYTNKLANPKILYQRFLCLRQQLAKLSRQTKGKLAGRHTTTSPEDPTTILEAPGLFQSVAVQTQIACLKRKDQSTQTKPVQQMLNTEHKEPDTIPEAVAAVTNTINEKENVNSTQRQGEKEVAEKALPILDVESVAKILQQNNITSPQDWEEVTVADISTPPPVTADSKMHSSKRGIRARRTISQEERQNWFNLRPSMVANYGHSSSRSEGEAANP